MAGILKLTIDTTSDLVNLYDTLVININTGSGVVQLKEQWVSVRTAPYKVSMVDSAGDTAESAVLYYLSAWNVDYKNYGGKEIIGTVTSSASSNLIEMQFEITDPVWTFEAPSGSLVTKGIVSGTVVQSSVEAPNSVSGTIVANAADPCGKVSVDLVITGDTGVYNIYTSESNYLGVSSPYTIDFIRRAVYQKIRIDGLNHPIGLVELNLPRKINSSDISVDLTYDLSGSVTVSANVGYSNVHITPYEYSLDGSTYQSSNSFSSVLPGNYTLYVKDAFGCVTTKDFLIDGTSDLTEIVFNISEVNPLRFVENREAGDKKNFFNSFACEELKQMAYAGVHYYPNTSTIAIQFQTNAPYMRVYAEDTEGNETDIAYNQSVKNTGLTGYTTASMYSVNGRAVLYWGYVDELDPLTDEVIGNSNFGAFVPTWADDAGKILEVENVGAVTVSKLYYDADKQANVAELSSSYVGPEITVNVKGTFNEQPYDVYEFLVDMASLPDSFRIHIDYGVDENSADQGVTSEIVTKIEDSDEFVRIDYWSDNNVGNFIYQTDIKHHIYVRAALDYIGEQSTEGYNGDSEYYKINDEIYFSFNLIAEFLPSAFAHKMRIFCAHDYFYVNGIKCKLAEAPEIEGEVATNLKTFTALLKVSGNQFLPMELQNVLSETDNLSGALEAIQGKANLLWTKING